MRILVQALLDAQPTLLQQPPKPAARQAALKRLQERVPAPVLAHYLRMVEHGRKGAVLVRNGVCTGCHLRVASGIVCALRQPADLHLCDNCGAYLLLAPEEMPRAADAGLAPLASVRKRKPRAERVVAV